jgi:2-oxoisovalerate dehydrogenase E1 component alpha subunit
MSLAPWANDPTTMSGPRPDTLVQFLTPQGAPTAHGKAHGINVQLARELYRDMVLARRFDAEAFALQRQGELNLWLMSWGQEAAQVGSIRALRDSDMVFPSYREHAVGLCRGLSPAQLLTQWRGCSHSGWDPATCRLHIYSLVLGTQTLHATGYAAGAAMEDTDEVVAVYLGDGATSQGDVNEAFNWAAAGSLPVLFFCQNNQFAISTPASIQMGAPLHRRAEGFGLQTYHVDGNDVLAVHAVTSAAAEHIRAGHGPALIEAQTYRLGGHSTSDDPGRYRSADEFKLYESRDPLSRLRILLADHHTDAEFFDDLDAECDAFAEQVRSACAAIDDPRLDETFENSYAEPHPLVDAEYAAFIAASSTLDNEI